MKIVPTPLGVPRHVVLLFLGDENLPSRPTHPREEYLGGTPPDPPALRLRLPPGSGQAPALHPLYSSFGRKRTSGAMTRYLQDSYRLSVIDHVVSESAVMITEAEVKRTNPALDPLCGLKPAANLTNGAPRLRSLSAEPGASRLTPRE